MKTIVGTTGRVTAGAHGDLLESLGGHPGHVVKHGPEMTIIGKTSTCMGKKAPAESAIYTQLIPHRSAMAWARMCFFKVMGK